MNIAYIDPLSRAWNRMVRILFQPFDFGKWLVLGFAAWLAGLTNGGGGGGGSSWGRISDNDMPRHLPEAIQDVHQFFARLIEHAVVVPLVAFGLVFLVCFIVLLVWLSSRSKFVFLDNVVNNRALIVEPWKRFREQGNSLFLWRICYGVVCIAIVLVIMLVTIGPAIGFAAADSWNGVSIAALTVGGLLFVLFIIAAVYTSLFLESFVIPIMYKYRLKTTEAWRYFIPWLTHRTGPFVLYGLFVLVLFFLFGFVLVTLCIVSCCVVMLPYVGTVLLLPAIVTYRLLSVEFLAQFDPGFDLFEPLALPEDASSEEPLPAP